MAPTRIIVHMDEYDNQLFWQSKMTQFTEGQDVEVEGVWFKPSQTSREIGWRKAKIVKLATTGMEGMAPATPGYIVQFPDGTRGVFDDAHIRAIGIAQVDRYGPWTDSIL